MENSTVEQSETGPIVWAIHAERDGQPWLRDWAKTEAEAQTKIADFEKNDDDAAKTTYWAKRLGGLELQSFQDAGAIPKDL